MDKKKKFDGDKLNKNKQSNNNFNKNRNDNNQFDQYLPPPEIQRGLNTGVMIEGVIRINTKNYEDAFICAADGVGQDIYIKGVKNRCRALNGDVVVVKLNPPTNWNVNHDSVQDFLAKHGTEEDHSILMRNCVVNAKVEDPDDGALVGNDTRIKPKIEMNVSVDSYDTPIRGPDSVAIVTDQIVEDKSILTGDESNRKDNWGAGGVNSEVKWDTGSITDNKLAMDILGEVIDGKGKTRRGVRGKKKTSEKVRIVSENKEGVTMVANIEQVANDISIDKRIPVERLEGVNPIDIVKLKEEFDDDIDHLSVSCTGIVVSPEELDEDDDVSDYESDNSDHIVKDIDQRLEDEAFRLANLKISDGNCDTPAIEELTIASTTEAIIDVAESESDDDDVVVEGTLDKNGKLVLESTDNIPKVEHCRKARRGRRGGKKGHPVSSVLNNDSLNTTTDSNSSCVSTLSMSGNKHVRRLPKVPLVEYDVESVLSHPTANKHQLLQKTGRVVFIREYKHSRVAAGTIKPMNDKNPRFFLFSPTDSKVPRMKIPGSQAPPNFFSRPEDYLGMMFVARITKWDMVNSALGSIERSLGHNSDISVRTEGLLLENNIDYGEFPSAALADLPSNHQNWSIPEQEIRRRRDFRQECVFTIDPLTARDLDDALSVTLESDGMYRVAVHIADVSYFVKEGTVLDQVAASRATSTYLVQQVVPMLPRPLCENLCSLNPEEDRLTFTVEWKMNERAQIVSEWFGRTVIRSCTKLAYEHAQSMIDHPEADWSSEERLSTLPQISGNYSGTVIAQKVNMLQKLALQLRSKREQAGALRLDQPKLCFSLNPETGLPDGYRLHEHRHSNKLIEEFMLLANMAVAHKIYSTFGDISVLRRHPPPKAAMMEVVVEQLGSLGVNIDSSTSSSLAQSIINIKELEGTPEEKAARLAVVTSMCSKPMELARYFCTGMVNVDEFHHFALNVPLYTHFTSPIRRYPDVFVHRLLDAAITGRRPRWEVGWVQQAAEHCNDMRLAAKRVGEASAELFLGLFIAQCGPVQQPGAVVQVMDHSLDLLILEMGVVKRVYVDKLGVTRHKFRRMDGVNYMDLVWSEGVNKISITLTLMSRVNLSLMKGDRPFEFTAIIECPERESVDRMITID